MYQPRFIFLPVVLVLTFLLIGINPFFPLSAFGFSFGGGGSECDAVGIGDVDGDPNCSPDDPLVIFPGPIGSPVRLIKYDVNTFLVADYSRRQLLWFDDSGEVTPFIHTSGRPLSIAMKSGFVFSFKIFLDISISSCIQI